MTQYEIAALLSRNNKGEQDAIDGYFQLLNEPNLPAELYDDIAEIISDEMNHSHKLSMWATKLTGIEPNPT